MATVDDVHPGSGDNSQDSKEAGGQKSMLELLMVTDAAVKALNKSTRSQSSTSSHASRKSDRVDPLTQSQQSDRSVRSAGSARSGKSALSGRSEKSGKSYQSGQSSVRSQQSVQSRDDNGEDQISKRDMSHDSGVVSKTQTTTRETTDHQREEPASDVSTTASDVLIRSTHEPAERSLLGNNLHSNSSTSSKCSKASIGLENFNSTGPQKVKVSKKRLKEIKSPFDDDESPRDSVSSDEKVPSSLLGRKSKSSISSVGSQHSSNGGKAAGGRKISPRVVSEKMNVDTKKMASNGGRQFPRGIDMDQFEIEKVRKSAEKGYDDVNLATRNKSNSASSGHSSSDDKKDREVREVRKPPTRDRSQEEKGFINGLPADKETDSSKPYRSTPKYFVQRHTPQKAQPSGKTESQAELPEKKNLLQDLEDSVEIITAHAQDTSSQSSQPEIVTVTERIVTINSKVSLSPSSSSCGDVGVAPGLTQVAPPLVSYHSANHKLRDDNGSSGEDRKNLDDSTTAIPPALPQQFVTSQGEKETTAQTFPSRSQWFSKQVHGHGLQQGAPVNGLDAPDKKPDVEIEVSDFKLTAKQRLARESFAKRQGGPVRRVVQPRFVGHDGKASSTSSTGELKPQQQLGQSNDQVLTAAAAASAAVAATQPFLKAQYEMEAKMAEVLNKIGELQGGGGVKTTTEASRVKQLEQQLADMTEKRIDYMEKLQEQQMAMQAKLLSLTREASTRPTYHARSYSPVSHQPSITQAAPNAKKAFSKSTISYPQPRVDHSNTTRHSVEPEELVSPLDTPAPRGRAPKPTVNDTSDMEFRPRSRTPKSRSPQSRSPKGKSPKARSRSPYKDKKDPGILYQILATSEVPVRDPGPYRPRTPVLQTRQCNPCVSPNVKKAQELEVDLCDIKDKVKGLVEEKENRKRSALDSLIQAGEKADVSSFTHEGPAPLDSYLKMPEQTAATPYKSVPDLSFQHFNAPVLPGFLEARIVLQQVQQNRGILEANLEAVLHARHNIEVYNVLEALQGDSVNPEMARIQKMVDKNIKKLRREVEREVTDDLVLRELSKAKATSVPGAVKVPAPAPAPARSGAAGRYGIRARQLQQEAREEPPAKKPAAAARKPAFGSRPPPKKTKSAFEDEGKLTQIYGKAAYQKGRTTVKDPYLHYQNTAKHKAPRPAGVLEVQGKERMSSKTQTTETSGVRQFYFNPNTGTYIPIAAAGSTGAPVAGHLVPMAVPLGGPRMDPGMSVTAGAPVTFGQGQGSQVTAADNVALVTVGGKDKPKPSSELGKQVLPAVDIDTDASEISELSDELASEVRLRSPERPKKHVQIMSPQSSPGKSPGRRKKESPVKAHYEVMYHEEEPAEEEEVVPKEREEPSVTVSTHSLTLAHPLPENNHHSEPADKEEKPVPKKRQTMAGVSISTQTSVSVSTQTNLITRPSLKMKNYNQSAPIVKKATASKKREGPSQTASTQTVCLAQTCPENDGNFEPGAKEEVVPEEREENSVSISTSSLTLTLPTWSIPENDDDLDDTLVEDDVETAPGLEFPGYQPAETPDVPYHGPEFPPRMPPADRQMTSDLIAEDIKRRDLLQNNAMDWIEQELMARIISEVYPLEADTRPEDLSHVVSEGSEDSMAEEREKSMFVMDSIGHRGMQLFVDLGYPVDNTLVNSLVKEVLQEKVRTMLGERPDQSDRPHQVETQPGEPRWEEPAAEEISEEAPVRGPVVSTPEPTPKGSPTSSPHRSASPAYTPIPSPPPGREPEPEPETPRPLYEPPPQPPVVQQPVMEQDSEPESSASYDIKEELRRLADQLRPNLGMGDGVQSRHDIATPPESPKPAPPALDMYRTLTPPELSPRPVQEQMMEPEAKEEVVLEEREENSVSLSTTCSLTLTNLTWSMPENDDEFVTQKSLAAGKERTPQVSKSDSPKSQPITEQEVDEEVFEDQPPPVMFTVAETQTDVAARPRTPTTPTKEKSRTPSESSYTESSSISDTFNECISEGQWLVNKSDGEVADFPVDQVAVRDRMLRMANKRVDVSSASTWKDIDEMDDMDDMSKSEGEFLYKTDFPPEKDPVLDLLARLQSAGPQMGLYNLNQNQITEVLDNTGKSEGEIIRVAPSSRGQQQQLQRHEPQRWEEPPVREVQPARRSNPSPRQGSPSPRRSPSPKSPKRSKSPALSRSSPQKQAPTPLYRTQSPTRVSFEDEYTDMRGTSPTRGILKQPRNNDSQGQGRARREEDLDLPVRDTSGRAGQSGRLTQGGRQPQGRGMIGTGGRTSPVKSSMRRPPQVIKSTTLPEASGSGGFRQGKFRGSSEDYRDSMDNSGGLYGSLKGNRSMTPDQMNTDALIQSGYLSQSFSQSELNGRDRTGQLSLRSSGDMPLSRTSASGRSLGYSYGTESSMTESELRRLATGGTAGKLQMSLTIPGTEAEASDLSEIDITDSAK